MTSTSKLPQLTFFMKVSIALITIGPLHTAAESSFRQSFHTSMFLMYKCMNA